MNQSKEITVIGHKSPDTDSICSAIAYAELKRKLTGQRYVPKRAGEINKETAFALSYFGAQEPEYLSDIRTRVSDMEIKQTPSVEAKISIKQAYSLMKEYEASTLCITDKEGYLQGLITMSNIAASDMDVYDNRIVSKAKTPYENIVKALEAKVICGDISGTFDQGRVTIAANTPERMVDYVAEHDMVITGNRFESQFFAIETGVSCIILCTSAEPNETIIERAKNKGCIILSSPYDSYTVARLINQSMPIDFFMTSHHILSFTLDDYPEIPQKNGYYAEWSTPVLNQLHTDTVVNVEYTPYIPSLSSSVTRENGRPVFFVDGFFGGSNAVQVTQQDITADVHGVTEQWLLEFTDDGNETHQIRYLTPGKAKGKVYVKQADGSWHKVETGSFGSYTTFTTTGTEVEVAFVPAKLPIWAFCAGGAALLVLLLLLAKRIKSKHGPKGEKPRREKKGKQPETADAPADELDTPISETDMQ